MTGHQINSLVGDLVAMAQAMERLPQVEAELDRANTVIEDQAKAIQRLEIKLIDAKAEADALQSTIRTLEASRDDAEFRFLEAEDRTASALAFVRTVFGNAGALIQALDPPKAIEPVKVASDLPPNDPVVSVQPDPFDATEATGSDPVVFGNLVTISADASSPQDQSNPVVSVQQDPTASSQDGSTPLPPIAPTPPAEPLPNAPTLSVSDPDYSSYRSWGDDAA